MGCSERVAPPSERVGEGRAGGGDGTGCSERVEPASETVGEGDGMLAELNSNATLARDVQERTGI